MCDWLNKFHGFSLLLIIYMTLVVDRMDGHDHTNTADHERLPKKTKVTRYQLQKPYPKDEALHL